MKCRVNYSDELIENNVDVMFHNKRFKRDAKQPARFADYTPPLLVAMQYGDVNKCRLILKREDATGHLGYISHVPIDVRVEVLKLLISFDADVNVLVQFRPFFAFVVTLMHDSLGTVSEVANKELVVILLRNDRCTYFDDGSRASSMLSYLLSVDSNLVEIMMERRLDWMVPMTVATSNLTFKRLFLSFPSSSIDSVHTRVTKMLSCHTMTRNGGVGGVLEELSNHFLIPCLCYISNDPNINMYFRLMTHNKQSLVDLCERPMTSRFVSQDQRILFDTFKDELQHLKCIVDRLFFFEHRSEEEVVNLLRRDLPMDVHTVEKAMHVNSVFESDVKMFGLSEIITSADLREQPYFRNYWKNAMLIIMRRNWTIRSHYLFSHRKRREVYTMLLVIKSSTRLQSMGELWLDVIFPYMMSDDHVTQRNYTHNTMTEKYGFLYPRVKLKMSTIFGLC